jgi:sugar phosphate isomerase/epimerase
MGARFLILHGGCTIADPRKDDSAVRAMMARIASVTFDARSLGVELLIENLPYYPDSRPFRSIFSTRHDFEIAAAHKLARFSLDIGHAHVNQWIAPALIRDFHPLIQMLSLSMNDGHTDDHLSLQTDERAIIDVLSQIIKTKWRGILVLDMPNSTPRVELDYLAAIWTRIAAETKGKR